MFDVLVFVYEHYWEAEACPELPLLGRRLSAAGFEGDEIEQALHWLEGLDAASKSAELIDIAPKSKVPPKPQSQSASQPTSLVLEPSANSLRIYSQAELKAAVPIPAPVMPIHKSPAKPHTVRYSRQGVRILD